MSREVKLDLRPALAAIKRGWDAGKKFVKVAKDGKQAAREVGQEVKHSKQELRALAREQKAVQKNQDLLASARDAFKGKAGREAKAAAAEAKKARAAARAIQGAAYRDSRINLQGVYATVGNLREKVPSLARSLADPAAGFSTLISTFGEGIAGVTAAAPFMAAAGGVLAMVKPLLEEFDKQSKLRTEAFVRLEVERQIESSFAARFDADSRFADIETNRAIDVALKNREDRDKAGWVNREDVEVEGF